MPTCNDKVIPSPFNFDVAHVRKDTRLSLPAQLYCSHSGAGKPGNEASQIYCSLRIYAHG